MSYLTERSGKREFVLFGICSGADYAFRVGCTDRRVVGLVLVDGYSYRTLGNRLRHYGLRLFRRRSWANVLTGKHPLWKWLSMRESSEKLPQERPSLGFYRKPSRREADAGLRAMVSRGVNLCILHSHSHWYNYRSQFKHTFPSIGISPQVNVEYLNFADHTFTLLASQDALVDRVESWLLDADRSPRARKL
jgi:hypothetical protein